MRNIKDLLQVMLSHQYLFTVGMCMWSIDLYNKDLISSQEDDLLRKYIRDNRPSAFSSWSALTHVTDAFFWKKGDITPRVKWLEKQINKTK